MKRFADTFYFLALLNRKDSAHAAAKAASSGPGTITLQLVRYTSATDSDPPIDATSTDAATIGNQFRLTGGQWHYNLNTRPLTAGTWMLIATMSDGSQHSAWVAIRR